MDDSLRSKWVHNPGRVQCFDEPYPPAPRLFATKCPMAPAHLEALQCLLSPEKAQLAPKAGGLRFTAVVSGFLSSLEGTELSKVLLCSLSLCLCLQACVLLRHFNLWLPERGSRKKGSEVDKNSPSRSKVTEVRAAAAAAY